MFSFDWFGENQCRGRSGHRNPRNQFTIVWTGSVLNLHTDWCGILCTWILQTTILWDSYFALQSCGRLGVLDNGLGDHLVPEEARHCLGRANAVTHQWLFSQCCNSELALAAFNICQPLSSLSSPRAEKQKGAKIASNRNIQLCSILAILCSACFLVWRWWLIFFSAICRWSSAAVANYLPPAQSFKGCPLPPRRTTES